MQNKSIDDLEEELLLLKVQLLFRPHYSDVQIENHRRLLLLEPYCNYDRLEQISCRMIRNTTNHDLPKS